MLLSVLPQELAPNARGSEIRITYVDTEAVLTPIWVAEGFPSDVRRELRNVRDVESGNVAVMVGNRISTGSQQILNEAGVSWADAEGHANIRAAGIYIDRLPAVARSSSGHMPWSRAASMVAEAILEIRGHSGNSDEVDRAARISDLTGISYAQVSRIMAVLDDHGFLTKVGAERGPTARRAFSDPGGLLSEWAGHYARSLALGPVFQFHVPWRDVERSLSTVERALDSVDWIVSGAAGAEMLAPFLSGDVDLAIYVRQDSIEDARRALSAHHDVTEVGEGGRIRLYPGEPYLFALADSRTYRTAPAVRIYGDLLRLRGRAIDAAEHLRETVIEL